MLELNFPQRLLSSPVNLFFSQKVTGKGKDIPYSTYKMILLMGHHSPLHLSIADYFKICRADYLEHIMLTVKKAMDSGLLPFFLLIYCLGRQTSKVWQGQPTPLLCFQNLLYQKNKDVGTSRNTGERARIACMLLEHTGGILCQF